MIVAKFGGSSLADARQFKKVKNIMMMNRERRFVVPSAPGKRDKADEKVTDLLYACWDAHHEGKDLSSVLSRIQERYNGIIKDLKLELSLDDDFKAIEANIKKGFSREYVASRGEYLNGKILAAYLEFDFVDAASVVLFNNDGSLAEEETNTLLHEELIQHRFAVVPGFYGSDRDGNVRTFSRGGSDVSGALVARAVDADMYENWTDVNGFCMVDPRIVPDAQIIDVMTYKELRELSYMGATVLHEDAVFPVRKAGIPCNIRNTNDPLQPGTMIRSNAEIFAPKYTITGIAGHKGFSIISIEKDMMNAELGFGRRVLQAFEEMNINFEHLPTSIDSMCVVIKDDELAGRKDEVVKKVIDAVHPDSITVHDHLALIATVGRGMAHASGTAARLFTAISAQGISIRTIDQGSSEINIIIGVDDDYFKETVKAIYDTFVRN